MEENCIDVLVHFTFKHSINSAANQTNYATSLLFAVSNIFEIICNTFLYLFTTLRDHLFSTYAKFSEKLIFRTPLTRTSTCVHQGVRKVCYSENLVCFIFLLPPFLDSLYCLLTGEFCKYSKYPESNIR